jgi:hypothetical protein
VIFSVFLSIAGVSAGACLAAPTAAFAAEYSPGRNPVFSPAPTTAVGRVRYQERDTEAKRRQAEKNRELFLSLKPGSTLIIQNSLQGWENEVVKVVDLFEDGSVRVRLDNGRMVMVKARNLASTLSPEVECGDSHGTKICKTDEVFFPARSTSLELPEGPVKYVFANGAVVIRQGADFVFSLKDVGKSISCTPQRKAICVNDYVFADGYRQDRNFQFEGPVERAYTNGVVVVRSDRLWRFPIDVSAVKKRLASEDGVNMPAVITTRDTRVKEDIFYRSKTTEVIEPYDADEADRLQDAR